MQASTIRGHLDGLEGASVTGWAVSEGAGPCAITVADERGAIVASGLADIERADLMDLGLGRCDLAFRVPLPSLTGVGRLHVLADGVELANSPLAVGPGVFDGFVWLDRDTLHGWVAERVAGFEPPAITILDQDGNTVLTCRARKDTVGGDRFLAAPFAGTLPDRCFGRGELRLTAYADGVRFAEVSGTLPLLGHVEVLAPAHCSGWLVSPLVPNRRLAVEVYRDGERVKTAVCDRPRGDVETAIPGASHAGFDAALPPVAVSADEATTLSFRFPGSDRELFEGPYVLGGRPAMVAAARRVARLAHDPAGGLGALERAVLQAATTDFLARARGSERLTFGRLPPDGRPDAVRLTVLIPVYRGVEVTRACIESVLRHRAEARDRIVLVNDRSPDPDMAAMLAGYERHPGVVLLTNETNLGFVRAVNRGLDFCSSGDVLLLNSDTKLFAGGLDELCRIAHSAPDIGTVTALSNNATIFSYPGLALRTDALDDIGWADLAAIALDENRGVAIDVPTGHGFCLLVRREVLRHAGHLDESFGRGYGEENDLCARAADLGYRNVLAAGVLVEHRESISFGTEKDDLLALNLPRLEARYPEYTPTIIAVQRRDDLRAARWALDAARLRRASAEGRRFALVVQHGLGGGTMQAIEDIEAAAGYGGATKLVLSPRADGTAVLSCADPVLSAVFAPQEAEALLAVLRAATVPLAVVHQMLGFTEPMVAALAGWIGERRSLFYAHDFYPLCPRVTMIDALGAFCDVAGTDICARCVAIGGAHEASRLTSLDPAGHRALFGRALRAFTHVVTPSESAAGYLRRAFPALAIEALPHPERPAPYPGLPRRGDDEEVVLLGAIGPHKGSAALLEIAGLARLRHPRLRFRVVGYTDRDEDLLRLGNVAITGPYAPGDLPALLAEGSARLALFLHGWPETFSYTLSEAVRLGLVPLVPDLGAPAERVRAAGFGAVFPAPVAASAVLDLIAGIASGRRGFSVGGAGPRAFEPDGRAAERTRHLLGVEGMD